MTDDTQLKGGNPGRLTLQTVFWSAFYHVLEKLSLSVPHRCSHMGWMSLALTHDPRPFYLIYVIP